MESILMGQLKKKDTRKKYLALVRITHDQKCLSPENNNSIRYQKLRIGHALPQAKLRSGFPVADRGRLGR